MLSFQWLNKSWWSLHVKLFKSREESELTFMVILVEAPRSPKWWLTVRHFCRQKKDTCKFRLEASSLSHRTSKSTSQLMDVFGPLCTKMHSFDTGSALQGLWLLRRDSVQAKLMCLVTPIIPQAYAHPELQQLCWKMHSLLTHWSGLKPGSEYTAQHSTSPACPPSL